MCDYCVNQQAELCVFLGALLILHRDAEKVFSSCFRLLDSHTFFRGKTDSGNGRKHRRKSVVSSAESLLGMTGPK